MCSSIKLCITSPVAFGESPMNRTQVKLWYNQFKEGREDVNDDACPDRPSTSTTDINIEAVNKMILDNRRITIREVAADVGISFGSCQAIFGCCRHETYGSKDCSKIC